MEVIGNATKRLQEIEAEHKARMNEIERRYHPLRNIKRSDFYNLFRYQA